MMGSDFQFREKIPVAILGATGSVGQRLVELLARHPWFTLECVAASERSVGKRYKEAVNWMMTSPLPEAIGQLIVQPCIPQHASSLVFSALDAECAGDIETRYAQAGHLVISNARNHRMDPDVPLLIPEVNGDHLTLLSQQKFGKGKIVTNPNCSTIGLCLALKPLQDLFGIESVSVVTLQAISGAGYPGVSSLDIMDNVIPFISGEEEKMEREPLKIFGECKDGQLIEAAMHISAQCNRVPVTDGHIECVSVKLRKKGSKQEIIQAWELFEGEAQFLNLPTAPSHPIHYLGEGPSPQPKLHRDRENGMAISIGRLRECPLLDYKFVILSHNTIRGAAGGALLNAELLVKKGYVFW
jgi:aspartate-semialdehyde dehydrogenase